MLRISSIFNSKKVPLPFTLCILLLLFVEGVVRVYSPSLITEYDALIVLKDRHLKAGQNAFYDGIILGDSQALGLDAKVVSDVLSESKQRKYNLYNYSLYNHGVRGYYLFLDKYLRKQEKPAFIILSASPIVLTRHWNFINSPVSRRVELHRFSILYSLKKAYEVFPLRQFTKVAASKCERLFKLVEYRKRIKKFLKMQDVLLDEVQWQVKDMAEMNGGIVLERDETLTEDFIKRTIDYRYSFEVDQDSLYWFKEFLVLAERNQIKVIVVNTPVIRVIYEKREKDGFHTKYERLMQELESQYDNLVLTKPLFIPYSIGEYFDETHLNEKGFEKFNKQFAVSAAEFL